MAWQSVQSGPVDGFGKYEGGHKKAHTHTLHFILQQNNLVIYTIEGFVCLFFAVHPWFK